ncbi:ribonuclease H family protein [Schaalia vaccimaxillae]|uniref:ribonuclease H family protein n=1 Tax=Schaalia vaccimaxillae TaxID=183916 RepID=UPI0003B78A73|nr:ribonuclease H [Schaalia vaccimaxillae]
MTITAAVDGSSLGNPGPAGWAWVVDRNCWDAGGWPEGTNNLGELTAVLELLKATQAAGLADEELHILADSQYAINVISKWRLGWKKRGWTKADKKPIKNLELIQEIDRVIEGRRVTFEWVKGHAGHTMNELADDFARGCAEEYQAGRTPERGPGFGGESSQITAKTDGVSAKDRGAPAKDPRASAKTDGAPNSQSPPPSNSPEQPDHRAVLEAQKSFIMAWAHGNTAALESLEAPQATRIWPDGHTTSGVAGPSPTDLKVGRIDVVTAGLAAWLVRYRIRWEGGAALESSLWIMDEGEGASLRLLHHQSTPIQ